MITFEHVDYTYPQSRTPALKDINLHLPEGSFALVVGTSGAGKSTLLRCTNGLVPHFSGGSLSGKIRINALDPVGVTPQRMSNHVGFVFQDPESQFVMDRVEDEIAFALENASLPRAVMRVRVAEALSLLDLIPLRDRRIETLSGGERQRVAIAAALALRPQVLVLDEPTSQLDPKSAEDVLQSLTRLNRDLGLTILLAEHRLERVLPFADVLVYLPGNGAGAVTGPPREVLEKIDLTPPLVTLGKALDWKPLPLTIKEGRIFAQEMHPAAPPPALTESPTRSQSPYIQAWEVDVSYNGHAVLHQVSIEVWPNEIAVLMGRNGAGKTTLLKSLVGLVRARRGRIEVAGQDIAGRQVAEICRQVGYLPQDPNTLLFADTVREELNITLRNHGLREDAGDASAGGQVVGLLERLGLREEMGVYPRDLSVGQRQRVALGAITVTQPGALLLDEPTRGLDYQAKKELSRLLRTWRDNGMAILMVTHDVELAASVADRVALMDQGEIIIRGEPGMVLGSSPLFAPQVARLFPGTGWLTPEDVLGTQT